MPPINDNFVDAIVLTGTAGTIAFDTTDATAEVNEFPGSDLSVWYSYTPTADLIMNASVTGSGMVLQVLRPDFALAESGVVTVSTLMNVGVYGQNSVNFPVQTGVTYYISIFGNSGGTGTGILRWREAFTIMYDSSSMPHEIPMSSLGHWSEWIDPPAALTRVPLLYEGASGDTRYPDYWFQRHNGGSPSSLTFTFGAGSTFNQGASDTSWATRRGILDAAADVHDVQDETFRLGRGNIFSALAGPIATGKTAWVAGAVYSAIPSGGSYYVGLSESKFAWLTIGVKYPPEPDVTGYETLPYYTVGGASDYVEWEHGYADRTQILSGGELTGNFTAAYLDHWINSVSPPDITASLYDDATGTELVHLDYTPGTFVTDGTSTHENPSGSVIPTNLAADLSSFISDEYFAIRFQHNWSLVSPPNGGHGSGSFATYAFGGEFGVTNIALWLNVKYPRYRYWIPGVFEFPPVFSAVRGPSSVAFYNPWG